MSGTDDTGRRRGDRGARGVLHRLAAVNAAAALLTLATGAVTGGTNLPGGGPMPLHHTLEAIGAALVLVLGGKVLLGRRIERRLAAAWRVAETGAAEDAARTLRLPLDAALAAGLFWVAMSLVAAGIATVTHHPTGDVLAFAAIHLIVGSGAAALTYLFAERELRPVFADALRVTGARGPTVRVRVRLLLGWYLGAAIPLLQVVTVALTPGALERRTLLLLAVQGLVVGPLLAVVAGDAVESRLARLRDAVGRVRAGELDVRVAVDEPGELGLLQSGVNDMVRGLQERDRAVLLFGQHVGVDVARRALASPDAPPRALTASMLFVDVVDSTGLTERRSPDHVLELLDALFEEVERVVRQEKGVVNQFLGDGALCLFGAVDDDPVHADHALRAARGVADGARRLAVDHPDLRVAVGVSAGRVVAGDVGARDRHVFTVVGSAVNEAARLVAEAKQRPGRTLAGDRAVSLAGEDESQHWRVAGEVQLRGLSSSTRVHEPVLPVALATRRAPEEQQTGSGVSP